MARVSAEATTKEFLSEPPANPLDSLMKDAARLYFSPMKMRESAHTGTKMRRKLLMFEATEEAVSQSSSSPKDLYIAVTALTSFTPADIFMRREYAIDQSSWSEHFSLSTANIVELELLKRLPALKRIERARYARFENAE